MREGNNPKADKMKEPFSVPSNLTTSNTSDQFLSPFSGKVFLLVSETQHLFGFLPF